MAEYPDVPLVIPNNQKKADCAPYVYGVEWQDVPASEGNPFYAAAAFRYDDTLSKAENREKAREFLKQVQRGDYFQMAADYYYGVGAHSMLFIADYDPETDSVHWADSNMKGKSVNGVRYAYVQYDAVKPIDWFVDAFCRKNTARRSTDSETISCTPSNADTKPRSSPNQRGTGSFVYKVVFVRLLRLVSPADGFICLPEKVFLTVEGRVLPPGVRRRSTRPHPSRAPAHCRGASCQTYPESARGYPDHTRARRPPRGAACCAS